MKQDDFRFKNSYESKVENSFQKLKFDTKTMNREYFSIKKYDNDVKEEVPITNMIIARRALVDQLGLAMHFS